LIGDALFDRWEAAWSGRDPAAFDALCAPGLHYEDPLCREPLQGAGALAAHAERLWAGFPDARMEKTGARLADGRFVAAPCKVLGHHRRALEGLPATGRFVVVQCVFYCEMQGGLLYRVRGFFDLYAAAVQLGVLPSPGTMGERALLMLRGFGLRARGERP
jgi:steroid delta-isomerase-like uncharacterized protein